MRKRRGYAVILSVMLSMFLLAAIISLAHIQHTSMQQRRGILYREAAHRAAESGIERGLQRLTANRSFTTPDTGVTEPCVWQVNLSGVTTECTYTYVVGGLSFCPSPPPGTTLPGGARCIKSKSTLKLNGTIVAERLIATIVSFDPVDYKLIHHFWKEE